MDPSKTQKNSTAGSAVGIAIGAVLIIAAVAALAYLLYTNSQLLDDIISIVLIAIVAIVVIAVGAALVIGIVAIPVYGMKGEVYQTDMSYDLDDVDSVESKGKDDDRPAH